MPTDLPIRCECGALRGTLRGVDETRGNRLVCYCDDCQSFAHFLNRGTGDAVLDELGGTDLFQTAPSRVTIEAGTEELAVVNLKPGGLMRWYARCCNTPIANTMRSPQMPFVGTIGMAVDHAGDGRSRDETLGPIRGFHLTELAKGDASHLAAGGGRSLAMLGRIFRLLLVWRLRGEHRPSPFFDDEGELRCEPRVLTADELAEVEARRDA